MSDESDRRMTVWAPEEMKDRIQTEHVDGKTSLSEWVRQAIRDRETIEAIAEEAGFELPDGQRQRAAALESVLREAFNEQ